MSYETWQSSGAHHPMWIERLDPQKRPYDTLAGDMEVEVAIVGGGIAGLSCAYWLAKAGRRVAVLEDGLVGSGESGRTSAHLASILEAPFTKLEHLHGADGARLIHQSHAAAIDTIERIVRDEKIPCGFTRVNAYQFPGPDSPLEALEAEAGAAARAGVTDVEIGEDPIRGFSYRGPYIVFPEQAQFNPMAYLLGLLSAIKRLGGHVCERTHVLGINGRGPYEVMTGSGHRVQAARVAVATNAPITERLSVHPKQHAFRTYVVGIAYPRGAIEKALFWDTAEPYHYVRTYEAAGDADGVLIAGGEDHATGTADDEESRFIKLDDWARTQFMNLGRQVHRWSGQVMESVDGIGYIGPSPGGDGTFIVTGDSGNGLTHGTIAGLLFDDLVNGRENPWFSLYHPARVSLRAVGEMAKGNLETARQYGDWIAPGEADSEADIALGEGGIVRDGLKKDAVYRDEKGAVHRFSATCRHLGCVVRWNGSEKTWDCPCHGSRYDRYGEVINGPAAEGLRAKSPASPRSR